LAGSSEIQRRDDYHPAFRAGRVEKNYGDLDELYEKDRLRSTVAALEYSVDDQRRMRPNPSKIPFDGDIRTNLASYKDAVKRYRKFRDTETGIVSDGDDDGLPVQSLPSPTSAALEEDLGQRIGLERDMQAALRTTINQLEDGLVIIDDGAERSVDSGFIDITARDGSGAIVVIELKTGPAGQRAVAQILSYMGDLKSEEPDTAIRGILVASAFDQKARSAARVIPGLTLCNYGVRFQFSKEVHL
jgi:hypothetical protein